MSLEQCYNKGCGQQFALDQNNEDSCQYHPGEPVFHDAYKGWSCCKKKCTDFTEFLNIKGCTRGKHSNIKPPEPPKPEKNTDTSTIEVKPIIRPSLERPSFDTPLIKLVPEIMPSLKATIGKKLEDKVEANKDGSIAVGTSCKNGGCTGTYKGPESDEEVCIYHPGYPVFHEGMKFWSCCNKRTTDFNTFLNQVGCQNGKHLWIKLDANPEQVKCRWDHHQTGTHMVVTIYAKDYCPEKSTVMLNPIRLVAKLKFLAGGSFDIDNELRGVIDVEQSQVTMFGTKVEIKLRKAEPGSWADLFVKNSNQPMSENSKMNEIENRVEGVDLSDL